MNILKAFILSTTLASAASFAAAATTNVYCPTSVQVSGQNGIQINGNDGSFKVVTYTPVTNGGAIYNFSSAVATDNADAPNQPINCLYTNFNQAIAATLVSQKRLVADFEVGNAWVKAGSIDKAITGDVHAAPFLIKE